MTVTVLSKAAFIDTLENMQKKGNVPEDFKDTFFISILDPDFRVPLWIDLPNYKTWWFYDLDYDIEPYQAMTEKQGRDIVDFILENKDKKHCIVHCSAGVSRSGAVGEFVNDLFGEDFSIFKRRNKNISPNFHVKGILNEYFRNEGRKHLQK